MSIYFVCTNPVEGREEEYNHWYDKVHLPEILAMFPNIVSAKRYTAADTSDTHAYSAVYEIEGDAPATIEAIGKAMASGALSVSEAVDGASTVRTVWVER
jgi:hypothetical protein